MKTCTIAHRMIRTLIKLFQTFIKLSFDPKISFLTLYTAFFMTILQRILFSILDSRSTSSLKLSFSVGTNPAYLIFYSCFPLQSVKRCSLYCFHTKPNIFNYFSKLSKLLNNEQKNLVMSNKSITQC